MAQNFSSTILICEGCGGKGVRAGKSYRDDDYPPAVTCSACEGSGMVIQKITYAPHHPTKADQ